MKRAKNNDAVRRSREKAKHQLQEKEKRLHFLETEHSDHFKQLTAMKQRIRELESENMALRKNCNCGSGQQIPPFRRWAPAHFLRFTWSLDGPPPWSQTNH